MPERSGEILIWNRVEGKNLGTGGRGRNRTYNLSVKSRMLCQLSYASRIAGKACGKCSCVTQASPVHGKYSTLAGAVSIRSDGLGEGHRWHCAAHAIIAKHLGCQ
jgi:hypothetical protein